MWILHPTNKLLYTLYKVLYFTRLHVNHLFNIDMFSGMIFNEFSFLGCKVKTGILHISNHSL